MTTVVRRVLLWAPRVLGILVALFVGIFALDALSEGLAALTLHLLPSLLLLGIVALAWRREWFGGAAFLALAAGYMSIAAARPTWVLAISGPLALVGVLFLVSWHFRNVAGRPAAR